MVHTLRTQIKYFSSCNLLCHRAHTPFACIIGNTAQACLPALCHSLCADYSAYASTSENVSCTQSVYRVACTFIILFFLRFVKRFRKKRENISTKTRRNLSVLYRNQQDFMRYLCGTSSQSVYMVSFSTSTLTTCSSCTGEVSFVPPV